MTDSIWWVIIGLGALWLLGQKKEEAAPAKPAVTRVGVPVTPVVGAPTVITKDSPEALAVYEKVVRALGTGTATPEQTVTLGFGVGWTYVPDVGYVYLPTEWRAPEGG